MVTERVLINESTGTSHRLLLLLLGLGDLFGHPQLFALHTTGAGNVKQGDMTSILSF
jgi:hypothetical protein